MHRKGEDHNYTSPFPPEFEPPTVFYLQKEVFVSLSTSLLIRLKFEIIFSKFCMKKQASLSNLI